MNVNNSSLFLDTLIDDHDALDPCKIILLEVVVNHIFSRLNLQELVVNTRVSKGWKKITSTPILWQSRIYHEIAFSSMDWGKWDAELVKDVDIAQEMASLGEDIVTKLRLAAFSGKTLTETHVLVRKLDGLTINKLGEIAKKSFRDNPNGYYYIWPGIANKLEVNSAEQSVWLLMTKDVLENSRCISYSKQENMVAELAKTTKVSYQVPTALQVATCILAEYWRSGNRLYSDSPETYTRCQDDVQGYRSLVGCFAKIGFYVCNDIYDRNDIGVAALWKF